MLCSVKRKRQTTLMNMLSGIYYPDSGEIYVDGKVDSLAEDAYALKIGMIHQHYKLIDVFTAAENIVLGQRPKKASQKQIAAKIKEICDKYGFDVDPDQKYSI